MKSSTRAAASAARSDLRRGPLAASLSYPAVGAAGILSRAGFARLSKRSIHGWVGGSGLQVVVGGSGDADAPAQLGVHGVPLSVQEPVVVLPPSPASNAVIAPLRGVSPS